MDNKFDKVVTHLQTTGYVFQGSQIYGGLSNTWDYGPLGSELKNNLQQLWWKKFVSESPTNVGIDAAILMNPRVWEATGHVTTFNDPLIDCKECRGRFRADDLVKEQYPDVDVNGMDLNALSDFIKSHPLKCPQCGKSNLMAKCRRYMTTTPVPDGKTQQKNAKPSTGKQVLSMQSKLMPSKNAKILSEKIQIS